MKRNATTAVIRLRIGLAVAALAIGVGCSHRAATSESEANAVATTGASAIATSDATPNGAVAASPTASSEPTASAPAAGMSIAPVTGASAAPAVAESPNGAKPVFATGLVPSQQTFDVQWKPETKVIDAATVTGAYRGVATDGSLIFDSSATSIAALTPGTVVAFSGLALRKVTSVSTSGSQIHVATTPAALDQAIANGHIAWKLPVDFSKVALSVPRGFHRVDPPQTFAERLFAEPADAAESGIDVEGKFKDWDVTLKLTPQNGNLMMDLEASKEVTGGKLDVHGTGEIDSLTSAVDITIADGSTTRIDFDNGNLHGKLDMKWSVAFDRVSGDEKAKLDEEDVENLPFALTFPFPVGPLPFELRIKSGFAFAPTFTAKTTVAQGEYTESFGGDAGIDASGAGDPQTTPITGDGSIATYGGTLALAPLGLSTTMELPELELSLGAPEALEAIVGEASASAYVALLTQANFIATGTLSIAQCERRELNIIGVAGVRAGLLGFEMKPHRKQYTIKTYSQVEPPNITLCQPK